MPNPLPDQLLVESPEQALALLNPLRAELLSRLEEPASASEVARSLGETPQRINYHIKALEKAGLVRRTGSRQVKNLVEVLYQAVARTFVISDALAASAGVRGKLPEQGALAGLARTAEAMRRDALLLLERAESPGEADVPSAVLTSTVRLASEADRQAFIRDYLAAVEEVVRRYASPDESGEAYTAALAVYPRPERTEAQGKDEGADE